MPHHQPLPDTYRLLSVLSGIPLKTVPALKLAGLWTQDDAAPITDAQRALLRQLTTDGRVRWVTWGPDGEGYVLTGYGEAALDVYHQRYGPANAPRRGPALASVIEARLLEALTVTPQAPAQVLVAAGLRPPGSTDPISPTHRTMLLGLLAQGLLAATRSGLDVVGPDQELRRTEEGTAALEAYRQQHEPHREKAQAQP
ncbi:hypothetical protein [Deinococcus sp. NW-56]|uniref:hypothetical protein n=1 Tax=Deinococcus sp. NW-56 TaxID=2080419 RepID=UPI000CF4E2D6|nr:hypothetical protein [Deinococcus sp. NW-56]